MPRKQLLQVRYYDVTIGYRYYNCIITFYVGRQFKEASRLAGEIKEVSSYLETEKVNVSNIEEKLSTSNKQLSLLSDKLGALKEQANTLEKEEGTVV